MQVSLVKRDSQAVHGIGKPYVGRPERWVVGGPGFFTAFRMTGGRARPCHSEEPCDEESQTIARILRIHPDKRDTQSVHRIGESWVYRPERWVVGGSGFFTAFRMTGGRAAYVILRSKATKNPKPLRDCWVCILTNETHGLYIEPESPMWVDLSAGCSEALDSSLHSE